LGFTGYCCGKLIRPDPGKSGEKYPVKYFTHKNSLRCSWQQANNFNHCMHYKRLMTLMNFFPESAPGNPLFILPLAALLVLSLLVLPAAATPPGSVSLAFGQNTSDLSVTIAHPVMGMNGHYIQEVKLTVNGNGVNDSMYTSQPADTFTYTYPLALKPGDKVEATAICSLSGSGSGTFIMPGLTATAPGGPGQPAVPTQKSSAALITLVAGIGIVLVIRQRV
jgi:hypothetical protein